MLQNPQTPKRLLLTNIGVAVVILLLAVLCDSKFFVGSSFVTFIVSSATLLYLILMRWQMVLPHKKEGDEGVKYPLSTKSTILYSLLSIIFWAMLPSMIMTSLGLTGEMELMSENDFMNYILCSFFTFCAIVVTLVVGLVARVVVLIKKGGASNGWRRLCFECLDVICTIVLYFVIYVASFIVLTLIAAPYCAG